MNERENTSTVKGRASDEQIREWKSQYGEIFALSTDDEQGRTRICYLRAPRRKDISAASVAGRVDPLKFNETILRQCWLGGDTDIRTDDKLFLSVSGKLADIIEVGEAQLEKL